MNNNIILISGMLAAGKTTFAKLLSEKLNTIYLSKDHIKELLADKIGFKDRNENLKLSFATFDLMKYVAENMMKLNMPIILESNFRTRELEILKEMINCYNYNTLVFLLTGDPDTLYNRFLEREPFRHVAHKAAMLTEKEKYIETNASLTSFDKSFPIINVDTTDFNKINFDDIIETAKKFLES